MLLFPLALPCLLASEPVCRLDARVKTPLSSSSGLTTPLEKVRAALTIFLFVPKLVHEFIEKAAKEWKEKGKQGAAHPDGCSCTTARLKALLTAL